MKKVEELINKVSDAMEVLGERRLSLPQENNIFEFFDAIHGGKYPCDVITTYDLLWLFANNEYLPTRKEIEILSQCLKDADFYRGDLRWEINIIKGKCALIAQFSPKHSGAFYEIEFHSGRTTLGFPITIVGKAYADMDDPGNHSDYCGYDEEGDCCCETFVIRELKETFEDRKAFYDKVHTFLMKVHYGD